MINKPIINSITKQTNNRFVNLYNINATNTKGININWISASRDTSVEEYEQSLKTLKDNAVSIYAEYSNKIVLIKQWRYPINDFIYEFPAGIIDNGESIHDAAIREFKEETGLDLQIISDDEHGYYPSCGLTNERLVTVFGFASGIISKDYQENVEDIEVILADKDEVKRILQNEKVALNTAIILQMWLMFGPNNMLLDYILD